VQQQVLYKTKSMQLLQARRGKPLEEDLRQMYVVEGRTLAEIGAELGVGVSTLSRWLSQLGIEARPTGTRTAA
jgi:transposase-like protein